MSDPQRAHGLQPTRLLHPWDFPGRSTGVGCHCLLRGKSLHSFNFYEKYFSLWEGEQIYPRFFILQKPKIEKDGNVPPTYMAYYPSPSLCSSQPPLCYVSSEPSIKCNYPLFQNKSRFMSTTSYIFKISF